MSKEERQRKIERKKSKENDVTDLQWNLEVIQLPEDIVGNEKIKVALEEFDGVFILFPTEKNVKLNHLKGYAKNAGEDISLFTTEEWKDISTPGLY